MNETITPPDSSPALASLVKTLLVSELYCSIQGESTFAGWPCSFVRLTGCPLRCNWCDSAFAFQGGERMTIGDILDRVASLNVRLVEVTGGEPLAQPNCHLLLHALCEAGYQVLLETSGALDLAAVDPRVIKVVDVKCPGSGEVKANCWQNLSQLGPRDELKFVLSDRGDFEFACRVIDDYALAGARTIHFSPVFPALDPAQLAEWILSEGLNVHLQLQLHKFIWPGRTQGI